MGVAHPGARAGDQAGDAFAHHHLLGVALGEVVLVGAADPAALVLLQAEHRQLDEVPAVDEEIEGLQFQGVDHVLGVVQHEPRERPPGDRLLGQDGPEDPVQAVGLAGRPGVGHLDPAHAPVAAGDPVHFRLGLLVVGVGADEDRVVLVLQAGLGGLQHPRDDAEFLPGRHHDGERRLGLEVQLGQVEVRMMLPDGHPADGGAEPEIDVDEQVVQAADQDDEVDQEQQQVEVGEEGGHPVTSVGMEAESPGRAWPLPGQPRGA